MTKLSMIVPKSATNVAKIETKELSQFEIPSETLLIVSQFKK